MFSTLFTMSLSDLGSWASLVSLVFTALIGLYTKSVNKTVQKIGKFKSYKTDKKSILNELKSLLDMLVNDDVIDSRYTSDCIKALSKLYCYKEFVTLKNRIIIWRIKRILKKEIKESNKITLNILLSDLIGSLDTRQEYVNNI